MSRVKNFPEKIHTAFTKQGEHVILSDKIAEALTVLGQRVQLYTVPEPCCHPPKRASHPAQPIYRRYTPAPSEAPVALLPTVEGKPKPKRHRLTKEAEVLAEAHSVGFKPEASLITLEAEPEAEITKTILKYEPVWKCTACGHKTDVPHKMIKGQFRGMWKCPSCGLKNTMVKNE